MGAGLNGFNWIAPVYDAMAGLVYGKAIREAQRCYLHEIPPQTNVVILGGGTGWILEELLTVNPSCRVWYIEASSRMLEKSRERLTSDLRRRVTFIHGTEQSLPGDVIFDVVITFFFLDLFTEASLEKVIGSIRQALSERGLWLVADFVDNNVWWQRVLLAGMYAMFRICCGIEAQRMPRWWQLLQRAGLRLEQGRSFYAGFIRGASYRQ